MAPRRPIPLLVVTIAGIVALAALLGRIGADAHWLAALGGVISHRHAIPDGIPFAGGSTAGWPNPLVLAELTFSALERTLGDRGLLLAQLLAAVAAMWLLARDSIAGGADPSGAGAVLVLIGLAVLPSLAIARVQMFSLVMFPAVVALLRSEARRPSRRIWWVIPMLALWANLHGGVILGAAVVLAYLLLQRLRRDPGTAVAVGIGTVFALGLTPALLRSWDYYAGVLTNVAAQRGDGLWGPLSLTAPLDVAVVLVAAFLALRTLRAKPPLWEAVVIAALAALTVHAARSGVWLLFFLAVPAARTFHLRRTWPHLVPVIAAAALTATVLGFVQGPGTGSGSRPILTRALTLAGGSPILASDTIAERIALDGGRIWIGDPVDAFSHSEQAGYLDWLAGAPPGLAAIAAPVRVVVVARDSAAARLMRRSTAFGPAGADPTAEIYLRRPA